GFPSAARTAPQPPQGGRSAVTPAFANLQRCRKGEAPKLPISPLEGEMSGRTERGAKERYAAHFPPTWANAKPLG
ncbi:MAG: hypothetical protein E5W03_04730, partial [Mesorhizobium sp.]